MKVLKDNAAEIVGYCFGVDIFLVCLLFYHRVKTWIQNAFFFFLFFTACVLHIISHSHSKMIIEIIPIPDAISVYFLVIDLHNDI